MTNIEHLIRLANRIGLFFEAMPDRAAGIDSIADHIRRFWDPRMRRALLDYLGTHPDGQWGDTALSPLCREAIALHRERLHPGRAPAPPPAPPGPTAQASGPPPATDLPFRPQQHPRRHTGHSTQEETS
ncbi:formate dehydrogenase subunit delta [Castellaniella defragrans]|uniref:NAD-dependent formate dehydrogenase delta subunit n=1 Tax=Castellaniella defragrans (strain DSM 12143 / CCUG 39792 / 65Phen) TaxID=1437824 RepID=W8X151_CASD6|nr:formate dehydrogenase subunit delta [Castellaniella defragrans]CDM23012.1 NAD-dependent formate dehydrogenase delta subunit [Castellaniella defragrans 65Phen]